MCARARARAPPGPVPQRRGSRQGRRPDRRVRHAAELRLGPPVGPAAPTRPKSATRARAPFPPARAQASQPASHEPPGGRSGGGSASSARPARRRFARVAALLRPRRGKGLGSVRFGWVVYLFGWPRSRWPATAGGGAAAPAVRSSDPRKPRTAATGSNPTRPPRVGSRLRPVQQTAAGANRCRPTWSAVSMATVLQMELHCLTPWDPLLDGQPAAQLH
jgi:hypothetical protein